MPSTPALSEPVRSALSFDIEDWFHVENLKPAIPRQTWDQRESRVERNTERILALVAARRTRCTCFVLGWVAAKFPALVKRIAAEGHEIASHGFGHELVYELTPEAFRSDIERTKKLLEDLTGMPVRGYRAPSFSITDWAVPILRDVGYAYDSSAFPSALHDRYGRLAGASAGRSIFQLAPGFHEVSLSCLPLGRRGVPWAGGGYFRLIPYPVFRAGIRRILATGAPYVFYLHPWEIDSLQPRVPGLPASYRLRHYTNLDRAEERLEALVRDFEWTTIADLLHRAVQGEEHEARSGAT